MCLAARCHPRQAHSDGPPLLGRACRQCGRLAFGVVEEKIAPERGVAGEDLVGTFSGEHDLDARIVHRLGQQELGDAVAVEYQRLGMPQRRGERVDERLLRHGYRHERGAGERSGLAR